MKQISRGSVDRRGKGKTDVKEIATPILKTDRYFYFVVYSIFMAVTTNLIQRKNQFVNPL